MSQVSADQLRLKNILIAKLKHQIVEIYHTKTIILASTVTTLKILYLSIIIFIQFHINVQRNNLIHIDSHLVS